jgi:DNA-binding MarR family transcriptional regulator
MGLATYRKRAPATGLNPTGEPEEMVGFWINLTSRTIVRVLDARLRPLGFALSHLPVLRALAEGGALAQKDLARLARVEQPTMAEMLGRMERDGLVEREQNPDDRRGSLISLARGARARFPKAAEALVEGERQAMAGFSDKEKALFLEFLQRVVKNLEG